jgi:hypothetical protein
MTLTLPSRAAGASGWGVMAMAFVLALAGCDKDPGLKATSSECDRACAHAAGLNKGAADTLTEKCPALCIERQWTAGDVRCLSDATTYDGVRSCAVAAKIAAVDDKKEAQLKEQSAKIERLLTDLKNAEDETQRAALQKQLEEALAAKNKLRGGRGAGTAVTGCTCEPGDTLCSML